MCCASEMSSESASEFNALPDDWASDPVLIAGLTVALVGDIAHSRTARSNIWGLKKLGAHVIVCGPSTLVSPRMVATMSEQPAKISAALRKFSVEFEKMMGIKGRTSESPDEGKKAGSPE